MSTKNKKVWIALFIVPCMILFVLIYAAPIVTVLYTSLCEYTVSTSPVLKGLENFKTIFQDKDFLESIKNTLVWVVLQSTFHVSLGFIMALVLRRKPKGWKFVRTAYMIPNIIPTAATGVMFTLLLNPTFGVLKSVYGIFGLDAAQIPNLFGNSKFAFWTVTCTWILNNETYLEEIDAGGQSYLTAAEKLPNLDMTSVVAAPRNQVLEKLNDTLRTYMLVLAVIVTLVLCISIIISRAVTRPIDNMIYQINKIAEGKKDRLPPLEMYSEFNNLADAFNHMLDKLDTYYKDNLEKQLLLKNAEIKALQSQMDPHFMFNTLNTIAWKAQMTNNPEIYQMVISLGELLKANVVSKDFTYVKLEDELRYVKFYTYLQKMRFEEKISVEIQADSSLLHYKVPCFCIQPLVENSIVHGLEPKKGKGKLVVNVIKHKDCMEILVADNGIGFETIPDICDIRPSSDESHTHIGLRNLDRRLYLLFGEMAHLKITSTLNVCTTISFKLPLIVD